MDLFELLRTAETEEDYEVIKNDVIRCDYYCIFSKIMSPVVLRAYLRHGRFSEDILLTGFYAVAKRCRVDLIDVFVPGFLTPFVCFTRTSSREREFRSFLNYCIGEGYVDIMKYFISRGMDVESPDDMNFTLLYAAVMYEKVDIIDLLFKYHAKVNIEVNSLWKTPAFAAQTLGREHAAPANNFIDFYSVYLFDSI